MSDESVQIMKKSSFLTLLFCFLISLHVFAQDIRQNEYSSNTLINKIIAREKSIEYSKEISTIVDSVNTVYGQIQQRITGGDKIRVFFDPAHGKIPNNGGMEWEGSLSWRKSTTGVPEEIYSIPVARKTYQLLSANPHIEAMANPEYLEVLKGNSDTYTNVTFDESVAQAEMCGAQIIIAEHLNNVAPQRKAEGFYNIPGLHITCNQNRTPLLSLVSGRYSGYYAYYNAFDFTGASKSISDYFCDEMISSGIVYPQSKRAAIADNRFTLYTHFPSSIIFESGFISNPKEEELLRTEPYQDALAHAKYNAIIRGINSTYGIDISHNDAVITSPLDKSMILGVMLSRIAMYYLEKSEYKKSVEVINIFEKNIAPRIGLKSAKAFLGLKTRIQRVGALIRTGNTYAAKNKNKKALTYFQSAIRIMGNRPEFKGARESAYLMYNRSAQACGRKNLRYITGYAHYNVSPPNMSFYIKKIENHNITTPYILTISDGQSLEDAVDSSFSANGTVRDKIIEQLRKGYKRKASYKRVYSKTKGRYIWIAKSSGRIVPFSTGVYIISFTKKMKIASVKQVWTVEFNPNRYQNQQFFKNSCLAERSKEKAL